MISNQQALLAAAEAILFASGDPIEPERIGKALSLSQSETEALLTLLATRYQKPGSGIQLLRLRTDGSGEQKKVEAALLSALQS